MLRNFYTYECRHTNDVPMCRALLCVGKTPSQLLAYAWVDTFAENGDLRIKPVEHDSEITVTRLHQSLNAICGTDYAEDQEEQMWQALHDHMIDKAEDKLTTRQGWYKSQRRRYRTSHYASMDAAMACAPATPSINLEGRLKVARDERPYIERDYQLHDGSFETQKKWTWDDFKPPEDLYLFLQSMIVELPFNQRHLPNTFFESVAGKKMNATRAETPKQQLKYILALGRECPTRYSKAYYAGNLGTWSTRYPCPLGTYQAIELAQMPYDDMMKIFADLLSWLNQWFAIRYCNLGRREEAYDEVKQVTWNADTQKLEYAKLDYDIREWVKEATGYDKLTKTSFAPGKKVEVKKAPVEDLDDTYELPDLPSLDDTYDEDY